MSIPGSTNPLLLFGDPTGGQYQIQRSLRFNSSNSGFLSRTPASAGNRQKWTWSGWVKRSKLGANGSLFGVTPSSGTDSTYLLLQFNSSDQLELEYWSGKFRQTTQVFRDCSAWYHIVCTFDTTLATAADRVKLYVNGTEITTFSSSNAPTQSTDYAVNSAASHNIGSAVSFSSSRYFDGYLADIHFIDGQALTPSSFTEVSATTGQLIPKAYSGTFGTNGFWLKFSDNSAATATTLGKDYSGNSNNWTPNNLSVTAGAGNDSLVDTPTSYGTDTYVGGEVRGNYATLNPLDNGGTTLSNGNLDVTKAGAGFLSVRGTIGMSSGKWYWEYTRASGSGNNLVVGLAGASANITTYFDISANGYGYRANDGNKTNNNTASSYGASYAAGDVVGIAFDADAGSLTFYKNGSSQGTAFTSLTSGPYFPAVAIAGGDTGSLNFGQRAFAYTAPSGFKALCDTNLPAPVVAKPNTVFDAKTYQGNGGSQTVVLPGGFSPDLVWIKNRSRASFNVLFDIVRGPSTGTSSSTNKALASDATDPEGLGSTIAGLTAFNSDGFTLASDQINPYNATGPSSESYIAWAWDAGSSTVTNTQGSITSQVRANASAGFSIVTYTGNGSTAQTIGHGLGVAPGLVIAKRRSAIEDWAVYHSSLGETKGLSLNNTAAASTSIQYWSNTNPTSTLFTVHSNTINNGNGSTYVAYCFAPVAGYSSFGSYVGNGSSDGVFVYTGFRPRYLLWKVIQANGNSANWYTLDAVTSPYNEARNRLHPNTSTSESTMGTGIDFLSNGFKLRSSDTDINGAYTYIYIAFAENPFQYARAR